MCILIVMLVKLLRNLYRPEVWRKASPSLPLSLCLFLSLSLSHTHTHTHMHAVFYVQMKVIYGMKRIDLLTLTLFKDALTSEGLNGVARRAWWLWRVSLGTKVVSYSCLFEENIWIQSQRKILQNSTMVSGEIEYDWLNTNYLLNRFWFRSSLVKFLNQWSRD